MDFSSYRARLPDLSKGAVAGAVIAMVIGFQWGGWGAGQHRRGAGQDRRAGGRRARSGADLR